MQLHHLSCSHPSRTQRHEVSGLNKRFSLQKVLRHGFSLLHHWRFYFWPSPSWPSSSPPLILPLFLLLFAKYPEFPPALHICVTLQALSSSPSSLTPRSPQLLSGSTLFRPTDWVTVEKLWFVLSDQVFITHKHTHLRMRWKAGRQTEREAENAKIAAGSFYRKLFTLSHSSVPQIEMQQKEKRRWFREKDRPFQQLAICGLRCDFQFRNITKMM